MAFFVWCEIVCANCARTVAGEFTSSAIPRRSMAKAAKAAGWFVSNKVDDWVCCSDCETRAVANKAERA